MLFVMSFMTPKLTHTHMHAHRHTHTCINIHLKSTSLC